MIYNCESGYVKNKYFQSKSVQKCSQLAQLPCLWAVPFLAGGMPSTLTTEAVCSTIERVVALYPGHSNLWLPL